MKVKIISDSAEKTMEIAEKIAKTTKKPAVISLVGDLGAGKTTFAKGFAKGLGIKDNITSPTFTILNDYDGDTKLYHFDLYRLSGLEEALALGFEEYFDLKTLDGIVLVEWAENAPNLLPIKHTEIQIEKLSEDKRQLSIEYKGLL